MTLSREEIAIELSDRIKEDWNWQIKPKVIERQDRPLEITCGTVVHTNEFHEYVERRILDLPAVEKNGMVGDGIIIRIGDGHSADNEIVLSRYHDVSGYDPEPDEEVIYP